MDVVLNNQSEKFSTYQLAVLTDTPSPNVKDQYKVQDVPVKNILLYFKESFKVHDLNLLILRLILLCL